MSSDIKEQIIKAAEQLFINQGYSKTSMRQVASACSISVGNLCYHFNKKEDILMSLHNRLLSKFYDQLPAVVQDCDPWASYFIAEYCFARVLIFYSDVRPLFMDVINSPVLRKEYYDKHNELFLRFLPDITQQLSSDEIYASTVAMCSLEFNLLEQLPFFENTLDFDRTMTQIFEARLLFLGRMDEYMLKLIDDAIIIGKKSSFTL